MDYTGKSENMIYGYVLFKKKKTSVERVNRVQSCNLDKSVIYKMWKMVIMMNK